MLRKHGFLICVVGLLVLTSSIWSLRNTLAEDKIEKIVTFQDFMHISEMESHTIPAFVHPNKGVGPTIGGYDLAIRIDYENVNGALHIDHYYSEFGTISERSQKLDEKDVGGKGSVTFHTEHYFIGNHLLVFTPDYDPGDPYSPIEIRIYAIHYESALQSDLLFFGLIGSFIGLVLASVGTTIVLLKKVHEN